MPESIIGTMLGNWKVLSEPQTVKGKQRVDVECLCGTSGVVSRDYGSLKRRGGSCGCLRGSKVSAARRESAPELAVGSTVGRLTITKVYYDEGRRYADYTCVCGSVGIKKLTDNLTRGQQGCRCVVSEATTARNTTHGMSGTGIHNLWIGMHQRCRDTSNSNYGGRGISVAPEWATFEQFYADMGSAPFEGATLERKDVNGDYSKENCVWVHYTEQALNKRNTVKVTMKDGTTESVVKLARELGLDPLKVKQRLRRGIDVDTAFEGKL